MSTMSMEMSRGKFRATLKVQAPRPWERDRIHEEPLTGCELSWFFPGPDRRYNGTREVLPLGGVEGLRADLEEAWATFERVVATKPGGVKVRKVVGRFAVHAGTSTSDGIEVFPGLGWSRLYIHTRDELESFLDLLEEAETSARQLQALLD